jgi:hypothetical protein
MQAEDADVVAETALLCQSPALPTTCTMRLLATALTTKQTTCLVDWTGGSASRHIYKRE